MAVGVDAAALPLTSEAARACLAELRARAGRDEGPIERHSVRVFLVMRELARRGGLDLDEEVALCAALLHDAGLYERAAGARFYLAHGREIARRVLAPFGWPAERRRLCLDAVELHHRLRPQWERGSEVELLRVADLVDATGGLVRAGLDRVWLRDLFRRIPRRGLYPELLRHSVRGAPCMTRGLAGAISYGLSRRNATARTRRRG